MSRCLALPLAIFAAFALALVLFAASATASFPSAFDMAHDAQIQILGPDDDVTPFLSAICPDDVLHHNGRAACRACPDDAPSSGGMLTLRRVYRGHFSGGSTEEAIVALNGCADDPRQRHATALLQQVEPEEDRWELVDFEQGRRTTPCRVQVAAQSPVLVCRDAHSDGLDVHAIAHTGEQWHTMKLASIEDSIDPCELKSQQPVRKDRIISGPLVYGHTQALGVILEVQQPPSSTEVCADGDASNSSGWQLDIFTLDDDGFERIHIDEPCAHPYHERILTELDPGSCR